MVSTRVADHGGFFSDVYFDCACAPSGLVSLWLKALAFLAIDIGFEDQCEMRQAERLRSQDCRLKNCRAEAPNKIAVVVSDHRILRADFQEANARE